MKSGFGKPWFELVSLVSCAICAKPIPPRFPGGGLMKQADYHARKCCSRDCMVKYQRRNPPVVLEQRYCRLCSAPIPMTRPHGRTIPAKVYAEKLYCSRAHRGEWDRLHSERSEDPSPVQQRRTIELRAPLSDRWSATLALLEGVPPADCAALGVRR